MSDRDLVEAAEPNPLLRRVDGLCSSRDWDGLVALAERCREAVERGKQLWPIADYIDYRLALEAPGEYAGVVISLDSGRFALGPLTEVAACRHSFDELAPYLASPQISGVVAAERVIRGEVLVGRAEAHGDVLELPLELLDWEPTYSAADYRSDKVQVPEPDLPSADRRAEGSRKPAVDEPEITQALTDLVSVWISESNGRADASVVDGEYSGAVASLGTPEFMATELTPAQSLGWMAWAAASSGAHGRRRGAAAGRAAAWWAAAEIAGLSWPPDIDELKSGIERLKWYRWEIAGQEPGWTLNLAVEDPDDGWAAAIAASDRAD